MSYKEVGFEVRDLVGWLYGQGFPKSRTSLKPAFEPVILARRPLEGTVARNVLKHGTGALNIDGCRVPGVKDVPASPRRARQGPAYGDLGNDPGTGSDWDPGTGRWPPNLVLAHSQACRQAGTRHEVPVYDCAPGCPVAELDSQSGNRKGGGNIVKPQSSRMGAHGIYGKGDTRAPFPGYSDEGGASRFFPVFSYEAKAPASERPKLADGTAWPTVKPLSLM